MTNPTQTPTLTSATETRWIKPENSTRTITAALGAIAAAVRAALADDTITDLDAAIAMAAEGNRNGAAGCLMVAADRIRTAATMIEGAIALHTAVPGLPPR